MTTKWAVKGELEVLEDGRVAFRLVDLSQISEFAAAMAEAMVEAAQRQGAKSSEVPK